MNNLPSTNGTPQAKPRVTVSEAFAVIGALLDEKAGTGPGPQSPPLAGAPAVPQPTQPEAIPSAVAAEIHALREQVTNQARFQRLAMAGQGLFWLIVLVVSHWSEIKPWCDEAWGRSVNGWGITEFVRTEDQAAQHKAAVERIEKDLRRAQTELDKQKGRRENEEEVAELLVSLRNERAKLAEAEGKLHTWREQYKQKKK